ncbi:helix-turn-helix transcriptional regulator [Bacilliculturomica massiliensis]|uniref:helix-turn-helix transcriptional regulator n=1 Tax=Bacilliculturomica massiliensis TaxID=1917867 RepID=UPI0013EEEA7A|nr:WYL domain-containing protein [Bacilliculturomica massiliensis]
MGKERNALGRVGNCLQMLFILQARNGGLVKISELADRLEVGERMIRSYREDLSKAGIFVESVTGKNGGYRIPPGHYMRIPALTEAERSAVSDSLSQMWASDTFLFKQDLRSAVEKILADQPELGLPGNGGAHSRSAAFSPGNGGSGGDGRFFISGGRPQDLESGRRNVYLDFNAAVIEKCALRIRYYSNGSQITERVIRPYGLVAYQNAWYCIAYCELRGEIRAFKLARVQRYERLQEHFAVPEDFNIKEHVGDHHLMKGEKIRLELQVDPPLANHVSERVWGENQKTKRSENGGVLLSVDVEDTPELLGWILSLGKAARVLGPAGLQGRVSAELSAIAEHYR